MPFTFSSPYAVPDKLVPGSELRVLADLAGHLALFGVAPTWLPQVDRHLRELLAG